MNEYESKTERQERAQRDGEVFEACQFGSRVSTCYHVPRCAHETPGFGRYAPPAIDMDVLRAAAEELRAACRQLGNPLGEADFESEALAWLAEHPEDAALSAREMFIRLLKAKLAEATS